MAHEARGGEEPAVRLHILPLTKTGEAHICPRVLKTTATAELVELDGFTFIRKRHHAPTSDDQHPCKRAHATAAAHAAENALSAEGSLGLPALATAQQGSHAEPQPHEAGTPQAADGHDGPLEDSEQVTAGHQDHEEGDGPDMVQPLHQLLLQDLPADLPTSARLQVVVSSMLLPAQLNMSEGQQVPATDGTAGAATAASLVVQRFGALLGQQVAAARALLIHSQVPPRQQGMAGASSATIATATDDGTAADAAVLPAGASDAEVQPAAAAAADAPSVPQGPSAATPLQYTQIAPMVRAAAEGPGLRAALTARLAALLEEEAMWQRLAEQHQSRDCAGHEDVSTTQAGSADTGDMMASVEQEGDAGVPMAGADADAPQQGNKAIAVLVERTDAVSMGTGGMSAAGILSDTAAGAGKVAEDAPMLVAGAQADCALALAAQETYEAMATQVELLEGEVLRLQELLRKAQKAAGCLQAQYHATAFQLLSKDASPRALIKGITSLPGPALHTLQAATPAHA